MKLNNTKKCRKKSTGQHASPVENFVGVLTPAEAARVAEYSETAKTTPESMENLGLTIPVIIEKYLDPLLSATKIKYIPTKGNGMQVCRVPDNTTILKATEMALRLQGAFRPPEEAKNRGVEIIVIDIPRPDRSIKRHPETALPEAQSGASPTVTRDPRPADWQTQSSDEL